MSGPKSNGAIAGNYHPAETQETTEARIFAEPDPQRKRLATVTAEAAIKGHTLQPLGSGFMLSRWGNVRYLSDLDAVEAAVRGLP